MPPPSESTWHQGGQSQPHRGLLAFAALLGFMETVLYTALIPLIPGLAHELALSTTEVGLLSAAYPAGMLIASVPAGYAADNLGPRVTAGVGLWVLALGSFGFAFLNDPIGLDSARFLQGSGAAAAWAGALAWLATTHSVRDRGGAMGIALSAAFSGLLLGPAIGAIATAVGRQDTFLAIGVGLGLVALWGGPQQRTRQASTPEHVSLRSFLHPALVISLGSIVALGVIVGALSALGPLLLADRGLGAGAIALCFASAAVPQVLFTPALGRRLGRSGLVLFCVGSMFVSAVLIPLITVPVGELATAVVFSIALVAQFIAFNPLILLTSAVTERLGSTQGLAMALSGGAWGFGASAGALGLGKLADVTSIPGAFLTAALIPLTAAILLAFAARACFLLPNRSLPVGSDTD